MKELLKQKGIAFEEVSIDTEDGLEEAEKLGIQAVPTLVKDGKIVLVGLPVKGEDSE